MILENLTAVPATNPSRLMSLRDGVYAADLFTVAVGHLNIFSWLCRKPAKFAEICRKYGIKERPADVMLTLLKAYGLLEVKDGRYSVTALAAEHLTDSAEWNLGPYISSQKSRPVCLEMLQVLKTGEPVGWGGEKDEEEWALAMEREDFSETFTAAMDSRGAYLAPALAKRVNFSGHKRLLDIGGSSGIYAAAVVSKHEHMTAAVLDRTPVDKIARYAIGKRGLQDKIDVIAGDMFEVEFPGNCDIHLYSNVLHDWDIAEVRALLKKSYRALPEGGMLLIHDAHVNFDKNGPLEIAEYSVLLMYSTRGKCYSYQELGDMLNEIGFTGILVIPTVAKRSIILAKKV